ncbi:unnamed protein product [Ilex paraguariensis]|uniref:EF-hand domain-containing protein n=1 Tax=Ilex paraguariensis TaxID=185542 RepID=A0ABC8QRF9_9AQUA
MQACVSSETIELQDLYLFLGPYVTLSQLSFSLSLSKSTMTSYGGYRVVSKGAEVRLEEEQLRKIFEKYDKNGDHKLCKEELKEAFNYLGAYIPGWKAWRSLQVADTNGDGFITEDEMKKLVTYALKAGYTVK